jgi:hypothetical protein
VFGEMILAVAVLTSDELGFAAGLSEPLAEDEEKRISALYNSLSTLLPGHPGLMLVFQPLLDNIGGDFIVKVLDQVSGGIPIFGTGALDVTIATRTPMTIYNGTAYPDRLAVILLSGCASPHFAIDSIGEQKNHSQKAVITAAEGNRIISINNTPATVYMEKIGLITKGVLNTLFAFPLTIENRQGEKINNCIIQSKEANGSLVCSCSVSTGSTLYVGVPSIDVVLKTVVNMTRRIKEKQDRNLLFIVSCFSRCIALVEASEEMNLIQKELADFSVPYIFLYSGGETCPVENAAGRMQNRHHNYAIISCSF